MENLRNRVFYTIINNEIYQCKFERISCIYRVNSPMYIERVSINVAGLGELTFNCNGLHFYNNPIESVKNMTIKEVNIYPTADDAINKANIFAHFEKRPWCNPYYVFHDDEFTEDISFSNIVQMFRDEYNRNISYRNGEIGYYKWNGMEPEWHKCDVYYNPVVEYLCIIKGWDKININDDWYADADDCKERNFIKVHCF